MSYRVLAIDDEPDILDLVVSALEFAGFIVEGARNSTDALSLASENEYHAIVCDVMLPDFDGFTLIQRLRDKGITTPVLFLTAKDSLDNKLQGFASGGDDYLVKPFSVEEMNARVKALIKRTAESASIQSEIPRDEILQADDLVMNLTTHEVKRGKVDIELSPTEFKLLQILLVNKGRVVQKNEILEVIWNEQWSEDYSLIESYISYLRKKIDKFPRRTKLIITKRSLGYMIK